MPTGNEKINIVGIYYKDSNGDFDIYTEQKKNYLDYDEGFVSYKDGVLTWRWLDNNTNETHGTNGYGEDTFVLDDSIYNGYTDDSNPEKNIGEIPMKNAYDLIQEIESVLNRLPKTYKKSQTAIKTLYSNSKVLMRLNNLTNPSTTNSLIKKNALQQSLIKSNKLAARSSFDVKAVNSATLNQIEPKIQTTYGFSDLGKILDLNIDGYLTMDDGSYVTTHKIGYEDIDRYRSGETSCDSYLFLSPLNHSDIQVNGDTSKSNVLIKSNESLRVPIIYQYRMEDYDGKIFGKAGYKSSDAIVKNTKYANIIGIDIWLNTLSDTPKQYDIVVYSTYNKDNSISTGTITKKI